MPNCCFSRWFTMGDTPFEPLTNRSPVPWMSIPYFLRRRKKIEQEEYCRSDCLSEASTQCVGSRNKRNTADPTA
ncbi:MAG: hypothetical protein E6I93_08735 [Chloroflexi bacterium]|nr:MAG: hypothetical protein E6I93_08735 [Chloroflexota bacterium]